jgi:hypothetical protein
LPAAAPSAWISQYGGGSGIGLMDTTCARQFYKTKQNKQTKEKTKTDLFHYCQEFNSFFY